MKKGMKNKLNRAKNLIFAVESELRKKESTIAANYLYQSRVGINNAINKIEFDELPQYRVDEDIEKIELIYVGNIPTLIESIKNGSIPTFRVNQNGFRTLKSKNPKLTERDYQAITEIIVGHTRYLIRWKKSEFEKKNRS